MNPVLNPIMISCLPNWGAMLKTLRRMSPDKSLWVLEEKRKAMLCQTHHFPANRRIFLDVLWHNPIGSMYAIYGRIYHKCTPNVTIYSIHGSYGPMGMAGCSSLSFAPWCGHRCSGTYWCGRVARCHPPSTWRAWPHRWRPPKCKGLLTHQPSQRKNLLTNYHLVTTNSSPWLKSLMFNR